MGIRLCHVGQWCLPATLNTSACSFRQFARSIQRATHVPHTIVLSATAAAGDAHHILVGDTRLLQATPCDDQDTSSHVRTSAGTGGW